MSAHLQRSDDDHTAFKRRIDAHHLAPLWERLHVLVPQTPAPQYAPAFWRYQDVRPHVMRAGDLVTAKQAVRRVLILENPAARGQAAITPLLYAGLQLILPGEIAPSHRHTQSALRFVMEGHTAYTAVDGERIRMQPGDFIITPSWTYHDHGNAPADAGGEPVIWMDGLDIPMLGLLGAQFAQDLNEDTQPVTQADGSNLARYGAGLLPVRSAPGTPTSPRVHYPYARTREALHTLSRQGEPDPWDGIKLRYANPLTGGSAMASIATFMQWLPPGFRGKTYRSTDATVYTVVEGRGTVTLDGVPHPFEPRDVFVVPSWVPVSLAAVGECTLFSFSDRPLHQLLGVLREQRDP